MSFLLRVITYHRISRAGAEPGLDPGLVSATPATFRKHMRHLRKWYEPVDLDRVIDAFARGRPLPDRAVHVTLDDAYRDFSEVAWPILRELSIPVTVFIPTAYPDDVERSFWWDRLHRVGASSRSNAWRAALLQAAERRQAGLSVRERADVRVILRHLPHDEAERLVDEACRSVGLEDSSRTATRDRPSVLGWDELRRLQSEGVRFGTHTRHHVALTHVHPDRARREVRGSLDDLERELGQAPRAIAYPYGMYSEAVADIAREEGCVLGFTSADGLNRTGEIDPMLLRRSNISPRTSPAVFAVRMLPWWARIDRWRHRRERMLLIS